MFYDALENFLDSVHSRVISQALDNKNINPAGEADCFAVNVLKVLFLVKYVKEFQATTIPNITSLMVDNVDEDTYELQQRVEAALKVLVRETLVQEHSGNYVFLTEEEQEIGREIERQNVETGEIQNKISDLILMICMLRPNINIMPLMVAIPSGLISWLTTDRIKIIRIMI